jgi:hypothetical protein
MVPIIHNSIFADKKMFGLLFIILVLFTITIQAQQQQINPRLADSYTAEFTVNTDGASISGTFYYDWANRMGVLYHNGCPSFNAGFKPPGNILRCHTVFIQKNFYVIFEIGNLDKNQTAKVCVRPTTSVGVTSPNILNQIPTAKSSYMMNDDFYNGMAHDYVLKMPDGSDFHLVTDDANPPHLIIADGYAHFKMFGFDQKVGGNVKFNKFRPLEKMWIHDFGFRLCMPVPGYSQPDAKLSAINPHEIHDSDEL